MIRAFAKEPAETYPISIDFGSGLPGTPTAATWSAIDDRDGTDASAQVLVSESAMISGTQAVVRVKGGFAGHRYKLTCRLACADGSLLEEEIWMTVVEQ